VKIGNGLPSVRGVAESRQICFADGLEAIAQSAFGKCVKGGCGLRILKSAL
jgi:hypothetical protein